MSRVLFLFVIVSLTACVSPPQTPVLLDEASLSNESHQKKVGVMMTSMPKPNVYLPGADCLLCLAIAEAAHSGLSKHVNTLTPDDFTLVKSDLVREIEEKGVEVIVIEQPIIIGDLPKNKSKEPNMANRDFSSLKEQYGITHLLVVDLYQLGVYRSYASYIPTSDPKAVIKGAGYLVDLQDSSYKWYLPIEIYKGANGEWDEPPNYPALTNAYYQVIEMGREAIVAEF